MAATSLRLSWRHIFYRSFTYANRSCGNAKLHKERRYIHRTNLLLNGNEINITERCIKQLKKVLDKDEFLRIVIEGGGCSGFQYKFEIDTSIEDDDRTFTTEGGGVVVDTESLKLIEGSTIDYQEELIKSGFVVMTNPNADKGCSCGSSFSLKI